MAKVKLRDQKQIVGAIPLNRENIQWRVIQSPKTTQLIISTARSLFGSLYHISKGKKHQTAKKYLTEMMYQPETNPRLQIAD